MAAPEERQKPQKSPFRLLDERSQLEVHRKKIGEVLDLQRELEEEGEMQGLADSPEVQDNAASVGNAMGAKGHNENPFSAGGEEAETLGDSEDFAKEESPVEEIQEEPPAHPASSLMGSSSAILLAMPLGPPTPRDGNGQVAHSREVTLQAAPSPPPQSEEQPIQHRAEGEGDRDADTAALRSFLRQFQEVLPPQAAADCVVCALRPVRPTGCGDFCSCCSEAKKAAVQRLQHQFAVILPSSGVTAQELLQKKTEQPALAHLQSPNCNPRDSYGDRLLSAEEEKKELQQKLRQVLQQQQILQKEVASTTTQFRAQQETWERKDRLQQDQIIFLSAKLKAYSEELEALRQLRGLDPPDNQQQQSRQRQQQQPQLWRKEAEKMPEGERHFVPRPRSCTVHVGEPRRHGQAATATGGFRPRSKTQHLGTGDITPSLQGKLLGFAEEQKAECRDCISPERADAMQQLQLQLQQQPEQRTDEEGQMPLPSVRQVMCKPDPRRRAQTVCLPQQLLVDPEPLERREHLMRHQRQTEGLHPSQSAAKSDSARMRAKSAMVPSPLQEHSASSPVTDIVNRESPHLSFRGHEAEEKSKGRQEHLMQWEEVLCEKPDVLLDECEKLSSSLSSLQIDCEEADSWSPKQTQASRAQRLQSSFLPATTGPTSRSGHDGGASQTRSATQLPRNLHLQLESLRQQLLAPTQDSIAGLTQHQHPRSEKAIPTAARGRAPAGAAEPQLKPEVRGVQGRPKEALKSRATRARSVAPPATATTTSRVRSLTTVPLQQRGEPPPMVVPMKRRPGKGPDKGPPQDPESDCVASDTNGDQGREGQPHQQQQQQQQPEGRRSFECLYLSSKLSQEDSSVGGKEAALPQKELPQEQLLEDDQSQRKEVRWLARSSSCSFAAERALSHRLLYLMPRGETLHPRKLKQMIQRDELLQQELQLTTQQEGVSVQRAEADEQQQQDAPCSPTEQPAETARVHPSSAGSASGETEATEKLQKRGDDVQEEEAGTTDAASQGSPYTGTESKPPTPAFPQVGEVEAPSFHVEWACDGEQQAKHQKEQQAQQGQEQRQSSSSQTPEKCQLGATALLPCPSPLHAPLLHTPLLFAPPQQQQQVSQQQQPPLPWLAASQGLPGGFMAAPSQLQAVPGGYASCPLAVQHVAALSPRPVLVLYTSSCLQQQQQLQQQQLQQSDEESAPSGSCNPKSCCLGRSSGSAYHAHEGSRAPEASPICSNSVPCYSRACTEAAEGARSERGLASNNIPAGCSASSDERSSGSSSEERSSGSSSTEPWCLLCESAAHPVCSEGEQKQGSVPCDALQADARPPAPQGDTKRDTNGIKEPSQHCNASSPVPVTTRSKQNTTPQNASQPSVTSPRKLLPPQPSPDTDTETNPQSARPAQVPPKEAAGEAAGEHAKGSAVCSRSPRGRSKTACLRTPAGLVAPRGEAGSVPPPKPPLQLPTTQGLAAPEGRNGSKMPQQHLQQQQQCHEPQYPQRQQPRPPLATVAAQTFLKVSRGTTTARVATGHTLALRRALSALHSQPVLHQEGVDYLNPAPGDNASVSSVSSLSSLGKVCCATNQLPLQQKPQQQQAALSALRAVPATPSCDQNAPRMYQVGANGQRPAQISHPLAPTCGSIAKTPRCPKDPLTETVGAVESHSESVAAAQATHEQLERQILQLRHWQVQLHRQQHAQHQRLVQQQRLFQQQQRLFHEQQQRQQRHQQHRQVEMASGLHQRSVSPQVKQQHHLHFTTLPVPYVEMAPPSGGLVYLQVQESPRWLPGGRVSQPDPRYRLPSPVATAPGTATIGMPVQVQRPVLKPLTPSLFASKRDRPLTAAGPAEETLPAPIPPVLTAPSPMLLGAPHPAAPHAAPHTACPPSYAGPPRSAAAHPPFRPWETGA